MKQLLPFLAFTLLLSCKQDGTEENTSSGNDGELQSRIEQLELDNALKDSIINESLAYFNEIKSNLEAISVRRDQIRSISSNPELTGRW